MAARDIFIEAYRNGIVEDTCRYPVLAQVTGNLAQYVHVGGEFDRLVDLRKLLCGQPLYVEDADRNQILVPESRVLFQTQVAWYLGEVSDMKSAAQMIDEKKKVQHVVFDTAELNEELFTKLGRPRTREDVTQAGLEDPLEVILLDFTRFSLVA